MSGARHRRIAADFVGAGARIAGFNYYTVFPQLGVA